MPPARSIITGPDTLTIVTPKGTRTFTRADIPPAVLLQPIETIEANVNAALANSSQLNGMLVRVHIFAVNPRLIWTVGCFNAGLTPPATWWIP